MEIWNALKQPPKSALKQIGGGRLKGMTDVNPQWRYQAMTEFFGQCGQHWKYEIVKLWLEPATDGQVCAFAQINLYVKGSVWSEAIPGIGGSMLIAQEKNGLHVSDEAYKMAVTDALSVAMKMLGMAADIYAGLWDGSKYRDTPPTKPSTSKQEPSQGDQKNYNEVSEKQWKFIQKLGKKAEITNTELKDMIKWLAKKENLPNDHYKIAKLLLPEENFEKVFTEYCEYQSKKDREDGSDLPY